MAELLDIFNAALGHVGESGTINDAETEQSPQAKALRRFYGIARDAVLAEYNWRFAKRFTAPALYLQDWTPWRFAYTRPADALAIRSVFITDPTIPEPFEVMGITTPDGQDISVIGTDAEGASVAYTRKVTNVTLFSAAFVDCLAWRLAFDVCTPLNRDQKNRADCWRIYQERMALAASSSAREGYRRPPDSELVTVRG